MQSFSCANHMANGRNGTCCFLDFPYHCILLINLAGLPAIMEPSGKDLATTALAPITQHSPMVTPGIMQTFSPIHVYEPMTMGPLEDNGRFRGIILIVSIVVFLVCHEASGAYVNVISYFYFVDGCNMGIRPY